MSSKERDRHRYRSSVLQSTAFGLPPLHPRFRLRGAIRAPGRIKSSAVLSAVPSAVRAVFCLNTYRLAAAVWVLFYLAVAALADAVAIATAEWAAFRCLVYRYRGHRAFVEDRLHRFPASACPRTDILNPPRLVTALSTQRCLSQRLQDVENRKPSLTPAEADKCTSQTLVTARSRITRPVRFASRPNQ